MGKGAVEKVDVFMLLYVGDFLRDTGHLSCAEVGSYIRLLANMWARHGYLPLEHDRLARLAICDRQAWDAMWPALAEFFVVEGGRFTQKRLLAELAKARAQKHAAAESGRKGAAVKRAKKASLQGSLVGSLEGTLQATLEGTLPGTLQANGQRNASSSPSESESDPEPAPPAPARDPSGTEPVAPSPKHGGITAQWLLDKFGELRGGFGWPVASTRMRMLAQEVVDRLGSDPAWVADIEPTMRLSLEQAKDSQDPRDREAAFSFGTWVSRLGDLREQLHGMRPARRAAPARASPPRDIRFGHAPPSTDFGKAGDQKL